MKQEVKQFIEDRLCGCIVESEFEDVKGDLQDIFDRTPKEVYDDYEFEMTEAEMAEAVEYIQDADWEEYRPEEPADFGVFQSNYL